MNLFLWHVHGSWTTALVQGPHRYYLPVTPERCADGRGRAQTWEWPDNAIEVTADAARDLKVDAILLQRPEELDLARRWLGRKPGRDIAAIYVEHNTPKGGVPLSRHPVADRDDLVLVHVTHFNDLFWDSGSTRTRVIEHAVVDPGHRYTGELERSAVVINEPLRRGRVTGTDLLPRFARAAPIDLFGMGVAALGGFENLPQDRLHEEIPRRRLYLHPIRWTSLGLSLIEAMYLGMPVVALATTEAPEAIPEGAGVCSTSVDALMDAIRFYRSDAAAARRAGSIGREYAKCRYNLKRFLADWNTLLDEVVAA